MLEKNHTQEKIGFNKEEIISNFLNSNDDDKNLLSSIIFEILKNKGIIDVDEDVIEYYFSKEILLKAGNTDDFDNKIFLMIEELKDYSNNFNNSNLDEESSLENKKLQEELLKKYEKKYGSKNGDSIKKIVIEELKEERLQQIKEELEKIDIEIVDKEYKMEKTLKKGGLLNFEEEKLKRNLEKIKKKKIKLEKEPLKVVSFYNKLINLKAKEAEENDDEIKAEFENINMKTGDVFLKWENIEYSIKKEEKNLQNISDVKDGQKKDLSAYLEEKSDNLKEVEKYINFILEIEKDYVFLVQKLYSLAESIQNDKEEPSFEDSLTVAKKLGEKTKSEIFYFLFNIVQSVGSGAFTSMGLTQVVPNHLYQNQVFLSNNGTPNDYLVYSISGIIGLVVGGCGGKIRNNIMEGIQRQAMRHKNLNSNDLLGFLAGILRGLFINKDNKFSIIKTIFSITTFMIIFGCITPKKDGGIFNCASVPSTISGLITFIYGDEIRNKTKDGVTEQAIEAEYFNFSALDQIEKTIEKMIFNMEKHVEKEVDGNGSNKNSGIGPIANTKNIFLTGRPLEIGNKKLQLKTKRAVKRYLAGTRFDEKSYLELLNGIKEKYNNELEKIFSKLDPSFIDNELDYIINNENLYSVSVKIKTKKVRIEHLFNELKRVFESYQNDLNILSSDAIEVLERIETDVSSDKNFDINEFLPKLETLDFSKITEFQKNMLEELGELNPFITDTDSSLEKVSNYPKTLKYLFDSIGILFEIFGLVIFGPFIYKSGKKRYLNAIENLSNRYCDIVKKGIKADFLAKLKYEKEGKYEHLFEGKEIGELQNYAEKINDLMIKILEGFLIHLNLEDKKDEISSSLKEVINLSKIKNNKAPNKVGENIIKGQDTITSLKTFKMMVDKILMPQETDLIGSKKFGPYVMQAGLEGDLYLGNFDL